MLKLIKNDFYLIYSQWFYIIISIFFWLILFKSIVLSTISVGFSLLFLVNGYESQYSMYEYFFSLPIKRIKWVVNRYITSLLFALSGYILSLIIMILLNFLLPESIFNMRASIGFEDIYEILFSLLLVTSFYLPSILKFGNIKGLLVFMGSILLFFTSLLGLSYLAVFNMTQFVDYKRYQGIRRLVIFLDELVIYLKNSLGRRTIMIILFLIVLFIFIVSIFISIKIFKKKEF